MMNQMFSMFEPSNYLKAQMMIPIMQIMLIMSEEKNKTEMMKMMITKKSFKEMKTMNKSKIMMMLIMATFTSLSVINITSMIPSSFSSTSHISVMMPLTMSMFMMIMTIKMKNFKKLIYMMTPQGSPTWLAPMITMIELTSMMIRPMTLTVRMNANMMSGHLIIFMMNKLNNSIMMIPCLMMNTLEMSMSMLQSYIFCLLITVYLSE